MENWIVLRAFFLLGEILLEERNQSDFAVFIDENGNEMKKFLRLPL